MLKAFAFLSSSLSLARSACELRALSSKNIILNEFLGRGASRGDPLRVNQPNPPLVKAELSFFYRRSIKKSFIFKGWKYYDVTPAGVGSFGSESASAGDNIVFGLFD